LLNEWDFDQRLLGLLEDVSGLQSDVLLPRTEFVDFLLIGVDQTVLVSNRIHDGCAFLVDVLHLALQGILVVLVFVEETDNVIKFLLFLLQCLDVVLQFVFFLLNRLFQGTKVSWWVLLFQSVDCEF